MASVRLQSVSKRFGETVVVDDVTLAIEDREFLVLVGPSGCGKSTTLRMIAGLETASGGDIFIGDRRVNDLGPKDRDIAMVFQNYALYPHMNVYDNMAFGLRMRDVPRAEIDSRVKEAADILGLAPLLKRKPKQLSGGQRQRAALGRAIVRHPAVFLMDEPLSNLDAKLRVQTRAEIVKLHQRVATTMIYVTHDQVEAMTMGHRIVVMKDGVVQQVDTPKAIYDSPANQFVAGFIGSPTMSFSAVPPRRARRCALRARLGFRDSHPGRTARHPVRFGHRRCGARRAARRRDPARRRCGLVVRGRGRRGAARLGAGAVPDGRRRSDHGARAGRSDGDDGRRDDARHQRQAHAPLRRRIGRRVLLGAGGERGGLACASAPSF